MIKFNVINFNVKLSYCIAVTCLKYLRLNIGNKSLKSCSKFKLPQADYIITSKQ